MNSFGQTRSSRQPNHLLQTPDTFIRTPLPGMKSATAIIHIAPAIGAGFTQYTAEMEPGGMLGPAAAQRFGYVLEGNITVEHDRGEYALSGGRYFYSPATIPHTVTAETNSRLVVIEKTYIAIEGIAAPVFFVGNEAVVTPEPLMGDSAIEVRSLLPGDFAHDFAVNTMTYQPGASLSMVEVHVMEHGLAMLEGGGIYRLADCWYAVSAGDFIWMAPFCPQWFGALGKVPAKYLIYKDWNRHPPAA